MVLTDTFNEFLSVDDCVLITTSQADMQHSVDKFSDTCNNFRPAVSTKKTKVLQAYQPIPGKPCSEPNGFFNW